MKTRLNFDAPFVASRGLLIPDAFPPLMEADRTAWNLLIVRSNEASAIWGISNQGPTDQTY